MWGTDAGRGGRSWREKTVPGWWYQESTCPFPQPTLQVRPQFPRQDLLGVEGKVRIMDSLALTPLPAADSSGEAGPGGLSALASPDQGRGLKGVPGGRKRQTDSRTRRPGAMQARQKACDPDWAVGGAPRLQLRSLAVQCRLFLAGVVIPTVRVRGHRVSVGALGPTLGLPEPRTGIGRGGNPGTASLVPAAAAPGPWC